jgi:predicted aspartyl protease
MPKSALYRVLCPALFLVAVLGADAAISAPAANGSAPLAIDSSGHFTMAVRLNGQGPFRFIVDTGSGASAPLRRIVARLKAQSGQQMQVIGANGSEENSSVVVADFRSGVFDRHDESMPLISTDLGADVDGVLGMNAFLEGRIEFDFDQRTLFASASGPPPEQFIVLPGEILLDHLLVVDVAVNGVHAKAVIDTGSKRTVANPQLQTALGFQLGDSRLIPVNKIGGATSQLTQAFKTTLGTLSIGGRMTIADPEIVFSDLPIFHALGLDNGPAMIIGIDRLSRLQAMAIDYPRAELQMRP